MYFYNDFTKKDKARLREIVSLSANKEAGFYLKEIFTAFQSTMEKEHEDMRVPFWEINNKFKSISKKMMRKYDGYSHQNIPIMIADSIINGYLTEEDIAHFSDEGKEKMKFNRDEITKMNL